MIETNLEMISSIFKERSVDARKYDHGLVVVIGGSEFYSGSPALSALAAFRTGADMVKVVAPERAANIIASFSPDLAALGLAGKHLNESHLNDLIALTKSSKEVARGNVAVVIGGGLGRSEDTRKLIHKYLEQVSVPVVIDADAIHALKQKTDLIKGKNFLITPHYFEFFSLTGREVYNLSEDEKIAIVTEEASRLETTILLKGKIDICSNGQETYVNKTGSPYLTVGGCGDVLAGVCGSMLSRGVSAVEAGAAAAFLNGRAGEKIGCESMTATDIIESFKTII
jgi:ADP-dependent NAD(P)H-hydrate dehydratase / NAD(P)H-hydrate epimerase